MGMSRGTGGNGTAAAGTRHSAASMTTKVNMKLTVTGVVMAALMVLGLGVQSSGAQSPPAPQPPNPAGAPPKPAGDAPPPPDNPKPEADNPAAIHQGRRNINPAYAKNLAYARLSNDFLLQRPDRRLPDGITGDEAVKVSETLAGGIRLLRSMQDSEGAIDTHSGDITGGYRPNLAGNHALSMWVLLACGISPEDPVVKKGAETMVDFATRGLGGIDRVIEYKKDNSRVRRDPKDPNPQSFDKLDTEELCHILSALEALAHARANESESGVKKAAEDEPAKAVDGGVMPLVMRPRAVADLKRRLSKKENDCAKGAVEALMKRYDEEDSGWGDHVNYGGRGFDGTYYAVLGLLSATRIGAWVPKKAVLDSVAKSCLEVDNDKCRRHTLRFLSSANATSASKDESTVVVTAEFDCRHWSNGFNRQGGFQYSWGLRGFTTMIALRRLMVGTSSSVRGGSRTKELDKALCEALAGMSRYLPPTGPDAAKVPRPEEQDREYPWPSGKDYADPYKIVPHSGYPDYWQKWGLELAQAGLFTGNDTFGHCEWFPDLMRNTMGRLDHIRHFKEAPVPENEDDDAKAARLKAKDTLRRKFGPMRCKELLMLALCLDKVPVWVAE